MTIRELVLIAIIWIVLGLWISWKRKWYYDYNVGEAITIITIIFSPLVLILGIFKRYGIQDWALNNKL